MANYRRRKTRDQWGSVTYDARKKVGVIRYWASTDDRGYMRHCKTVRGTRQEVEEERAKLMLEHGKDRARMTVGQVYDRWYLPSMERALSDGEIVESTARNNRSAYGRLIEPTWKDTPLDQVKPLGVQKWINGLSLTQAKKAMPILRKIMTYAVRYGCVDSSPMNEDYDMPSKTTVERRDDGVWSAEELPEVWRVFWGSWIEASVLLQGFASCRFGESLSVRGTDVIDLTTGGTPVAGVVIDSQVNNRREIIDRTKTEQSVRVAVMAGYPAIRLLHLAKLAGDGLLTHDGFGGAASQTKVRRAFESTLRKSDVEYHLIKNLRKSWQTIARWTLRIPPQYSEPMMGHVGTDVTSLHYDKPSATMFAEVLADHYSDNPFADGLEWQLSTGFEWERN